MKILKEILATIFAMVGVMVASAAICVKSVFACLIEIVDLMVEPLFDLMPDGAAERFHKHLD